MSGGVDSAVAALLCGEAGDVGRGHARAVGGSRERRRAQLLLGLGGRAGALAGPRARAAALHPRPARGVSGRRRGRRSSPVRGGRDAQPVRRLQRPRPPRRDDRPSPTVWLRASRHRPLRPDGRGRDPAGPLLRAAADPAKDQTYMLAALAPSSLARMRFPLGELTKPEVRALAAAAGLPVAGKSDSPGSVLPRRAPTARASSPATAQIGEPAGDRSSTSTGRSLGHHDGQHRFTVGQRRGLGRRRRLAALRARQGRHGQRGHRRPARRRSRRDAVALRGVRLHRPGERVDRVKLRYRSAAGAGADARCRAPGPARARHGWARAAGPRGRAGAAGVPDGRRAASSAGARSPAAAERGHPQTRPHQARSALSARGSPRCGPASARRRASTTPVGGAPGTHAPPDSPGLLDPRERVHVRVARVRGRLGPETAAGRIAEHLVALVNRVRWLPAARARSRRC